MDRRRKDWIGGRRGEGLNVNGQKKKRLDRRKKRRTESKWTEEEKTG